MNENNSINIEILIAGLKHSGVKLKILEITYKSKSGFTHLIEIRNKIGCSSQTLYRHIKKLEELGLVELKQDFVDRRKKYIILTRLGKEVIEKVMRQKLNF